MSYPINTKKNCVQNRNFCGVCSNSYIANNYPNLLKSQGHINNVLEDHYTISKIVGTHFIGKKTQTEHVNNIAKEAVYQLQYYKNLYLAHKKIIEVYLIIFSTITKSLISIHV